MLDDLTIHLGFGLECHVHAELIIGHSWGVHHSAGICASESILALPQMPRMNGIKSRAGVATTEISYGAGLDAEFVGVPYA